MERSSRIERTILQRLLSVGQESVARHLGVDESTISRLKSPDTRMNVGAIAKMLDLLDLKVVPSGMKCFRPEDIDPYIQLAKRHMEQVKSAEELVWEDRE